MRMQQNKRNNREKREMPTAGLKNKTEGNLDNQWVLGSGGIGGRKGCMVGQDVYIQKETLRKKKLEIWKVGFVMFLIFFFPLDWHILIQ